MKSDTSSECALGKLIKKLSGPKTKDKIRQKSLTDSSSGTQSLLVKYII